ncbi:isopenicillin N synthase family oxygenase [bacterium]|nr:isopenicillin N synthase family oxygenase [bacterium]
MSRSNLPLIEGDWIAERNRGLSGPALRKAFEEIGFAVLLDPPLEAASIEALYAAVRAFFSLPEEVKLRYRLEGMGGQRGYTPFGVEHAKNREQPDLKEFWQFGPDQNPEVVEVPDFGIRGREVFQALESIGTELMKALAMAFGGDPERFAQSVQGGESILRPIHYPGLQHPEPEALRSAEHEDINAITLLMGASAGGLQLLGRDGNWFDAEIPAGALVINVGDMLERLSGGKLKSTTHRVINTPDAYAGVSRYSIPFFLHFRSDVLLVPPSDWSLDAPGFHAPLEPPITAGSFLDQRLREIGLK